MTLKFRFQLFLLLFICLSSINPAAQTPPPAGTATVAGRVTLGGDPERGVHVVLQAFYPSGPSDRDKALRAKTDAEGHFRFTGVNAGQYIVSALAPGFVTSSSGPYNLPGKPLNLSDGETVAEIELTLERGGVITGRVTDAQGEPLVENTVRLVKLDERGVPMPVYSNFNWDMYQLDDRGVYRLYGLAPGKYKVSVGWAPQEGAPTVQRTRTVYPRTFHPDTPDEAQAKVIELDEGGEVTDVDIKVGEAKPTYKVAGRVVDAATGLPLVGVEVGYGAYINADRLGGFGGSEARTNADGEFQIQSVLPGRYAAFIGDRLGESDLLSELAPFNIADRDISGLEIKAQRGGAITGTAAIEGTNDPALLAKLTQTTLRFSLPTGSTPGTSRSARIRPPGVFHVVGLRAGKVNIEPVRQYGLSLLRVELNGAPLNEGIEMRAGEQINNVRVVLAHGSGVIRGQVKISGGTLPEGMQLGVSAYRKGSTPSTSGNAPRAISNAHSDVRGYFVLKDLLPGEYELRLYPSLSGSLNFYGSQATEMNRIFRLINMIRQIVAVSNGAVAQAAIVIDLTPKENER